MQPAEASPPSTSSTAPLGRPAPACRLRSTILPPPASTAGSTCQAGTTSDEQAPGLRALTALRGPSSRPCATREVGTLFSPPRGGCTRSVATTPRSEEHTSELQSHHDLVCRLLLEKKKKNRKKPQHKKKKKKKTTIKKK